MLASPARDRGGSREPNVRAKLAPRAILRALRRLGRKEPRVSLFTIARRPTRTRALCVAVVVVAMLAGAATNAGAGRARTGAVPPDLVFSPTRGIGGFDGFGVQLNQ